LVVICEFQVNFMSKLHRAIVKMLGDQVMLLLLGLNYKEFWNDDG